MTGERAKNPRSNSSTLLEALAKAIDGTDEQEAVRLAAEFNDAFGHLVRASVEVESVQGAIQDELLVPDTHVGSSYKTKASQKPTRSPKLQRALAKQEDSAGEDLPAAPVNVVNKTPKNLKRSIRHSSPSSEGSDVKKHREKKKKKKAPKKKQPNSSDSSSSSDPPSDTSSSEDGSSDTSSEDEDAELCYEITDFDSADLPDLPEKWDKGFRKLRSYVPLTLFNPALLESFHDEEGDPKAKEKLAKSKSSLKALERQLTYGYFIEMCDLEERYAREIYGLDTYADYVVKHKKIVSDLKKTYNCWMIGLRYHLKVRTVIFRRRKLIKSKVKGKTVLKDKVKIPNGLQPLVERQARHDADRAGDLQHTDNPYAPGGAKFGFSFSTGRAVVLLHSAVVSEKALEEKSAASTTLRGRRGGVSNRPYPKRTFYGYPRVNRFGNQLNTQNSKQSLAGVLKRRLS